MRALIPLPLVLIACLSFAATPVKLTDDQLRAKIAGVWFGEELPAVTTHIGERYQYFPDGRFVADYRISGPGTERYIRSIGTWKVSGGQFSETVEHTNFEKRFPTFIRHVTAIDTKHIVLETSDGTHAELFRGKAQLENGTPSLSSLDRAKLLKELASAHVSGFHSVPAGNGMSSFRLDSRKIEQAKHQ
jgi:hypothetical protein